MKKKNIVISSFATIALCLSLLMGSTFALFTSESKVNIAVTSGKVSVVANIDENSVQTKQLYDTQYEDGKDNMYEGEATFGAEGLTLEKFVPGDGIKFNIVVKNESTVSVKYRTIISCENDDGLFAGLKVDIANLASYNGSEYVGKWQSIPVGAQDIIVPVTIELPETAGNTYQEKTCTISYKVEAVQGNAKTFDDTWDGTADTSWYNDTDTEFTLNTAEQVAGLSTLVDGGNDFVGKTIKLDGDLDLGATDENGETICFDPIGSYRNNKSFKGTFDGQGYTISNLSQNTWALDNGYYYSDLGMGLFGKVEDATVKKLKIDGASISGENGLCGVVAGAAYGDCTFDNITVTNTKCNDYQYYAGGVVGWASGEQTYSNITIDESTILGSQWGDFGNCTGGVIGGAGSSAKILIKDSTIACRIDAVNDIVSAYQWHCYRNCGMLIGNTGNTATDDAVTNAAAPNLTCENVTVIYGEWANYTYCEFAGTGYPYVRVQAGVSVDAYSNVRYGHPTDANGNTVVDDNHVHNDGEKHHYLIVFDQLYGGSADHRYCQYGVATHPGVTVIYNNK